MKGYNLFMMLIIILSVVFFIWYFKIDFPLTEGTNFCKSKGFEGTTLYGSYSGYHGKVQCTACYMSDCVHKEFNVTKKFGIIVENNK